MKHDIRWKQRFDNYKDALVTLESTVVIDSPTYIEKAACVKFYEMTFELAWKVMKDYLTEQGFTINSPREAIKQALQSNLIEDGHKWLDALADRKLTVHIYDEDMASEIYSKIKTDFFVILKEFSSKMKEL